jgi:hypothetical protein
LWRPQQRVWNRAVAGKSATLQSDIRDSDCGEKLYASQRNPLACREAARCLNGYYIEKFVGRKTR